MNLSLPSWWMTSWSAADVSLLLPRAWASLGGQKMCPWVVGVERGLVGVKKNDLVIGRQSGWWSMMTVCLGVRKEKKGLGRTQGLSYDGYDQMERRWRESFLIAEIGAAGCSPVPEPGVAERLLLGRMHPCEAVSTACETRWADPDHLLLRLISGSRCFDRYGGCWWSGGPVLLLGVVAHTKLVHCGCDGRVRAVLERRRMRGEETWCCRWGPREGRLRVSGRRVLCHLGCWMMIY
mmetsp:Transcript_32696/g.53016  ORF Transcript_32696/g.53016 Transcript_32696/m.53016 type:complete len:236 (-) Transcript_32696:1362-2069(-)